MKFNEKYRSFKRIPIRGVNGFICLLGALAFAVAVSLSAEAQIAPGPPALLNANGASDAGDDLRARVTTDGVGNWMVVWNSREDLGGTAGTDDDIFVATSRDNGATWTAPALLNTNGNTDTRDDFFPQVTTDGAGNWVAVWSSTEDLGGTAGTDDDIFVATSRDNGVTWTAPALLNTNGTSDAGRDFRPQVTTDGVGNWVAVWQSNEDLGGTAGTDNDIFVATFVIAVGAPGDVNCDGSVTPGDAQAAFDSFLGISTPACIDVGDVCPVGGDGSVTPGDAQGIFNMFLGLPTPCE